MHGTTLNGSVIRVNLDLTSHDGSKLVVTGLARGTAWQDLKDAFSPYGTVLFAGLAGKGKGKGGSKGGGKGGGPTSTGEVRFETMEEAESALEALDNGMLQGSRITLTSDPNSKDGTKLFVSGIPSGTEWQELKDFCQQAGRVAYANVGGKGGGKGGGRGTSPGRPPAGGSYREAPSRSAPGAFPVAPGYPYGPPPPVMTCQGEVRFSSLEDAQQATARLSGSVLGGSQIWVQPDNSSQDGTRLIVHNIVPGLAWQELKDHFSSIGTVAFAQVKQPLPLVYAPAYAAPHPAYGAYAAPPGYGAYPAYPAYGAPPVAGPAKGVGEVRYSSPDSAKTALRRLDGGIVRGTRVTVKADNTSKDGTKILVMGLPGGCSWQELKDFMQDAGAVAFCKVEAAPGGLPAAVQYALPGYPAPGAYAPSAEAHVGEVRFEDPRHARKAVDRVHGTVVNGQQVAVTLNPSSQDGSKITVTGLRANYRWQELKDVFQHIGPVSFCAISGPGGPLGGAGGHGHGHGGAVSSKPPRERIVSSEGGAGEVRFANPADAKVALRRLHQRELRGSVLLLEPDSRSQDGSKVMISNLPAGIEWQELKDHFTQIGEVAYAGIFGPGEVRMSTAEEAAEAIAHLDGSVIDGQAISVRLDFASKDGSKLIVENLPPTCQWQELKDHFASCGIVSFAARAGSRSK
ncbi:unnamed protein product [Polarella glacialis]|nr:unnamed protein product [Polarella glacialis]